MSDADHDNRVAEQPDVQHCAHCDGEIVWALGGYRHVKPTSCIAFDSVERAAAFAPPPAQSEAIPCGFESKGPRSRRCRLPKDHIGFHDDVTGEVKHEAPEMQSVGILPNPRNVLIVFKTPELASAFVDKFDFDVAESELRRSAPSERDTDWSMARFDKWFADYKARYQLKDSVKAMLIDAWFAALRSRGVAPERDVGLEEAASFLEEQAKREQQQLGDISIAIGDVLWMAARTLRSRIGVVTPPLADDQVRSIVFAVGLDYDALSPEDREDVAAKLRKELSGIGVVAEGPQPENAWLLERNTTPEGPEYLTVASGGFSWTTDNLKALRLARREDADLLAEIMDDCQHIREHQWG